MICIGFSFIQIYTKISSPTLRRITPKIEKKMPRRGFLCRRASNLKSVYVRPSSVRSSVCHAQISQILPKKSKIGKNLTKPENFGIRQKYVITQIMFIIRLWSIIHKKPFGPPLPCGMGAGHSDFQCGSCVST